MIERAAAEAETVQDSLRPWYHGLTAVAGCRLRSGEEVHPRTTLGFREAGRRPGVEDHPRAISGYRGTLFASPGQSGSTDVRAPRPWSKCHKGGLWSKAQGTGVTGTMVRILDTSNVAPDSGLWDYARRRG